MRAQKMAEFEKWKNPPKANFVISKRLAGEEGAEVCMRITNRITSLSLSLPKVLPSYTDSFIDVLQAFDTFYRPL